MILDAIIRTRDVMHEGTYTRPWSRGVHDATLHCVNLSVLCLRDREKNSTFNTSAGEQTVVATVPCVKIWLGFVLHKITSYGRENRRNKGRKCITYRGETSPEMANNIILEVFRFEHLRFEEVIPGRLNQQGKRVWVN